MKKTISVILCLVMIMATAVPAFAAGTTGSRYPVVLIGGDGDHLEDKDGNELPLWSGVLDNLTKKDDGEDNTGEIYKSIANVLLPFLVEGLLTGNYDNYYENLQKEISEIFEPLLLNENGEASNGSGISQRRKEQMKSNLSRDAKKGKGYYGFYDYQFYYDWRVDPLLSAEELNDYIQEIKKVTGSPKVVIIARCLGTVIASAYVALYGTDDIYGVGFDGAVSNGAELLSEPISGKFKLDGNAINRFMIDANVIYDYNIDEFICETVELLEKSGALKAVSGVTKDTIYYTVIKGVTSALSLSTFCTWPAFWGIIKEEDFDNAMNYVFGEEGSEKRTEYAGLIEKINRYDSLVRKHIPELMNQINDNANLAIFSKYGLQITPVIESRNEVSDQFATVKCSAFGATASDIYSTLPEDYIAQRIEEGKGKYIAPDKQVDASTCMFPDQTWFIKGADHGYWTDIEHEILYTVATADRQLTVDDLGYTQYVVFNQQTKEMAIMTEENCDTYYWKANQKLDEPTSGAGRLFAFITMLFKWLRSLFEKLKNR